jgi:cyclic pyranopterin phosphate synthase
MLKTIQTLTDNYGRRFSYLRLSITDVCNFRCDYCLPHGYQRNQQKFLSIDEIKRAAQAFSTLGLKKIRLTGGEPTLRKDLFDIAHALSSLPTIQKLAITTNGYTLPKIAQNLYDSGIRGLNVSIDSLDRKTFQDITGQDKLHTLLKGIDKAQAVGFQNIKINAVLLKNKNHDLQPFLSWLKTNKVTVRMIELMQTKTNVDYFKQHHLSAKTYIEPLIREGWYYVAKEPDAGPAQELSHPDYHGKIGFIAPYSKDFCQSCNRLRMSALGKLYLCLFGNMGYNLRELLQNDDQLELLKNAIMGFLPNKHATHYLNAGLVGDNHNFSGIGG